MSDCVKYNGKTYRKEILFEKIREKPDFFTKKHDLSPADINKAVGENSDIRFSISNSNANFVEDENTKKYKDSKGNEIPYNVYSPSNNGNKPNLLQRKKDQSTGENNDFALVERQFIEDKNLNFTAGTKIESLDDVAWLFRNLEDEAVEHAFVTYVMPDGAYVVQHLGSGGITSAVVDARLIIGNAVKMGAKSIAFIHNHPSGKLQASSADMQIYSNIKTGLEDTGIELHDGVIINLRSGKYVTFNRYSDVVNNITEQNQEQHKVKILSFSKHIFAENYNPEKVTGSKSVVELLSTKKFGISDKTEMLVLNNSNEVVGKFILPENNQYSKIVELLTQYGGVSAIIYGNNINASTINEHNRKLKPIGFSILDAIEVKSNNMTSLADDGLLREPTSNYQNNDPTKLTNKEVKGYVSDLRNGKTLAETFDKFKESDYYKNLPFVEKEMLDKSNFLNVLKDNLKQEKTEATEKPKSVPQQTTQSRKNNLTTERIKPLKRPVRNAIRKVADIAKDIAQGLNATMVNYKPNGRNTLGTYNPRNTLVTIRKANDLDTIAHELGHLLDDRFDILGKVNNPTINKEIKWFYDRGGSNPPSTMKGRAERLRYRQREGIAEFIRALAVNPDQAKIIAPNLYDHFINSVNAKTMEVLQKFSDDYIDLANATNEDVIMSQVADEKAEKKKDIKTAVLFWKNNDTVFGNKLWGWTNTKFFDSMYKANKSFAWINKMNGTNDLLPEKDFKILSKLFNGVDTKIDRIFQSGIVDNKNKKITDTVTGEAMTVQWLFSGLDTTSEKTLNADKKSVTAVLIAERTIEYAKKFGRSNDLTGIAREGETDLETATNMMQEFNDLKTSNPEKFDRITEATRKYRAYADGVLQYAVSMGRLSPETYKDIKDNNEYYVNLTREKKYDYTSEENTTKFLSSSKNLTESQQIVRKAKGGNDTIKDPYESLLMTTAQIIKETDRNHIMDTFVRAMESTRIMGDGTPIDFAQIGTKVEPEIKEGIVNGERVYMKVEPHGKDIVKIYNKGEVEYWKFSDDMKSALNHLQGIHASGIWGLTHLASAIRWTVTNFPVFALRNLTRDTVQRFVNSRNVVVSTNGIKGLNLKHNAQQREDWEYFGGGMAGYYGDKNAYKNKMQESIEKLTHNGHTVYNLANLGRNYKRLLEKSENVNRIAEFNSAFKKAKEQGMDDYNAGLYAAYESRDLLDFATAGTFIKMLNTMIPFLNAGFQGIARGVRGAKENPTQYFIRTLIFTVLPQLLFKMMNVASGDDDEAKEFPAYKRDLFWNVKMPYIDKWLSIPKPFESGMIASGVDRLIDYAMGDKNAMEGYLGSLLKTVSPVDDTTLLGSAKPLVGVWLNKDTFRDIAIIPQWDEDKIRGTRDSDKYASRLGKGVSYILAQFGGDFNPNNIDHIVQGYGTYMGKTAIQLSNIFREDNSNQLGLNTLGFFSDSPIANSKTVQKASELAKEMGEPYAKPMRKLKDLRTAYYKEKDDKKKKEIQSKIYDYAGKMVDYYQSRKDLIKDNMDDINNMARDISSGKRTATDVRQEIDNKGLTIKQKELYLKQLMKTLKNE